MAIFDSVIFQVFLLILAAVIWFAYNSICRVLKDDYAVLRKKIGAEKPQLIFHCSAEINGIRIILPVFKVECYSEFMVVSFSKKLLMIKYASNISFTTTLMSDSFIFRDIMNRPLLKLYMYNKSNFAKLHRLIITSNATNSDYVSK